MKPDVETTTPKDGSESRIDRINLLEFLGANEPPEKVLYLCIIQDAASNYLYSFLSKNGTSPEEFFASHQYFFKVVSNKRELWDHHRDIKLSYIKDNQRVIESRHLTDNELKMMCFDKHYDLSGLDELINIDKFRANLKEKRRKILTDNWQQVQTNVSTIYNRELNQIAGGRQVPLQVWSEDLLTVLVDPPTPLHLANILYVPSRLKRERKSRTKKDQNSGTYSKLVEKLNTLPDVGNDWGPLATLLEGADNAKANDNNSCDNANSNTD